MGDTASTHRRIHVAIPVEVHRRLRLRAVEEGTTLSALVNAALCSPAAPAHASAPAPPTFTPAAGASTSGGIVGRALDRHR